MSDEIKFSCLSCGQRIVTDVTESGRQMLCPSCGANLTVPLLMSEDPATATATGSSKIPPPVPISAVPPTPVPDIARRTSVLAIASFIASLTSPIICIGWIPGIICGHLARAKIRRDPTLTGKGLATAGLIISYGTVIVGGLLTVFVVACWSAWFKELSQPARFSIITNSITSSAAPQMDTNEMDNQQAASPSRPNENSAVWTLDVKDATIPDDPASGQIHGSDFQLKRALFRNGNLKFISADGQESLTIYNLGQSIANTSLEFQTASDSSAPKVEIAWKDGDENKTASFQDGYAMELKFDNLRGRRIPGHIYLCLPDDSKSYLAGKFTIVLPKPRPKPTQ
jgi:DNA-directed RNA polymerase subunit RPC12/RpoP